METELYDMRTQVGPGIRLRGPNIYSHHHQAGSHKLHFAVRPSNAQCGRRNTALKSNCIFPVHTSFWADYHSHPCVFSPPGTFTSKPLHHTFDNSHTRNTPPTTPDPLTCTWWTRTPVRPDWCCCPAQRPAPPARSAWSTVRRSCARCRCWRPVDRARRPPFAAHADGWSTSSPWRRSGRVGEETQIFCINDDMQRCKNFAATKSRAKTSQLGCL